MLNHIVVMGRMVRDPELRRTGSGVAVTSFTVACDRDFSGQDGEKETDFIDCVAWRKTAETVAKYFTKGKMTTVSGRLQIRKWTDKEGNTRRSAEILADNVYFSESKREAGGAAPAPNYGPASYGAPQEPGGGYGSYGITVPGNDYALLDDDDDQLPY